MTREEKIKKFINELPKGWVRWCDSDLCYCMGCVNNVGAHKWEVLYPDEPLITKEEFERRVVVFDGLIVEYRYIGPPSFWSVVKTMLKFWIGYSAAEKMTMDLIIKQTEKELMGKYNI